MAIRTALAEAHGQFVIVQDADLEYDPSEYLRLIQPLVDGTADVVYGCRRLGCDSRWQEWLSPFYQGVVTLKFLTWLWCGVRLADEATAIARWVTPLTGAGPVAEAVTGYTTAIYDGASTGATQH
jgi:glycosyl transferase family 2